MKYAVTFLLSALLPVSAATLRIEPTPSSQLNLYVEKTGLLSGKKHHFAFERYHVDLELDQAVPERSRVQLRLESGSIVCKDTWVNAKDLLKISKVALEDMLAADRFPEIGFRSTAIRAISHGLYEVEGLLTIREITKPVRVRVSRHGDGYSGTALIKLTDYGLKPPSAALGLVGTKNDMIFSFVLAAR